MITVDPTRHLLSVRNLTTSFRVGNRWTSVVRNLNLDVSAGETVAIVGESGSGKSVTSLSIMRLLQKDISRIDGEIRLDGRDLLRLSENEMRNVRGNEIAMIFQEPMTSLNPVFTVGEQISEAIRTHRRVSKRQARNKVLELLDKVRISNARSRFDEYPHQFSGGMRQRVMIAMALASSPKLLIADEPTTALDVTIQGQVIDLIKSLQAEEQMAVLFITHDMGVVAEVADRTVVMFRGDVVEEGATAKIFHSGEHAYTRSLLSAVPRLGSMKGQDRPLSFPVVDVKTGTTVTQALRGTLPSRPTKPLLKVRDLTTRFDITGGLFGRKTGAVHAVEGVSFDLYPGETLGIVGESGCGKSTTGRSIMRLVNPTSGSIFLDGVDMMSLGKQQLKIARRAIQMVFQDPFASLNPRMTVGAAITEPYVQHGIGTLAQGKEKAIDLLGHVGLDAHMMNRYPHEFSGGQRQRLAIARALMLDPKVIVADEAVSALDVSIKAQVCNLLLYLQRTFGVAYLFISHDMAIVERMSHRIAVMYLGEIVEIGPRSAVIENPSHAYTRKLMSAVPIPDPSHRRPRSDLEMSELKSPVRPVGYQPPKPTYTEVGPGHFASTE